MGMYANIIKSKLEKYCSENSIENRDEGFMKFVNEIFYSGSQIEIDDSIINKSIVDGSYDKQIDLIQIEEDEIATIRIIQVKNTTGFSSNVVILLNNGLNWIFNKDDEDLKKINNINFKNRIVEIRDLFNRYSKKNIYIDVVYVTLGDLKDIKETDEISEEINNLVQKYQGQFENFRFELFGAKELEDYIDSNNDKVIDMDLPIIYDINAPSIIEIEYDHIKSIVCNIKAKEFIKIFENEQNEYLFEQNVRKYLDDRSKVNKNIIETASSEDSEYFWALNNGITIICDKADIKRIGGNATLEMKALQIINGCQTSMALLAAKKAKKLNDNTSLLLRVHQTNDSKVIEKIIVATNNQNPINSRDLVSNTQEQIGLQRYFFEIYNIAYQRKRNDYMDINGNQVSKKTIVSNDKVGQASLACIKCRPDLALSSKGKVFTTDIDVFSKPQDNIALSYFIYEKVLQYSKLDEIKNDANKLGVVKFGRFHITYLIYKKYISRVSIEFNKTINNNIIDLKTDIINAVDKIERQLTEDQKHNLLSYFKSKDQTQKIKNITI